MNNEQEQWAKMNEQELWENEQLIKEFIDHPMSANYRESLLSALNSDNAREFSNIMDMIARTDLGWSEEDVQAINHRLNN